MGSAEYIVLLDSGHIEVMNIINDQQFQALAIVFIVIFLLILLSCIKNIKKCLRSNRRIENPHQAPEIREPRDSQENVWSISIPEKPAGYWSLYNKDREGGVDVLRGQRQGAIGGGDHLRLQGLQGEIRVDEQGRAYVCSCWTPNPSRGRET